MKKVYKYAGLVLLVEIIIFLIVQLIMQLWLTDTWGWHLLHLLWILPLRDSLAFIIYCTIICIFMLMLFTFKYLLRKDHYDELDEDD